MSEHIVKSFDEELDRLDRKVAQMGGIAEHQLVQDAVHNALAAEDYDLMARLLTQTYKTFLAHGLLVSLQKWLDVLPAKHRSPRLRLAVA